MHTRRLAIAALPLCLALPPAQAQNPNAALGKQHAAASRIEWEARDAGHPVLGTIRFAFIKNAIETPVAGNKVFSRAYVSCQKGIGKFAIELTNATSPDDPKGLRPSAEPRLFCRRPHVPGDPRMVSEPLLANWDVNNLGDAMARGFRAFPLRECVAIEVVQDVELPKDWSQKSARVQFEITPYNRELDSVFAACGEQSAYAPGAPAAPAKTATAQAPPAVARPVPPPPAPAPVARPAASVATTPAPVPAAPATTAQPGWQAARVLTSGKTNVRAGPRLDSAVVAELHPGTPVLVQKTETDWWRARPSSGAGFDGYIRQDRLLLR
ncbi:MAG TPA: SH3 domain-containing protein [Usitatibacter sp.]|nr:SH3 domain-containing protein [Usitatibacter sp.]